MNMLRHGTYIMAESGVTGLLEWLENKVWGEYALNFVGYSASAKGPIFAAIFETEESLTQFERECGQEEASISTPDLGRRNPKFDWPQTRERRDTATRRCTPDRRNGTNRGGRRTTDQMLDESPAQIRMPEKIIVVDDDAAVRETVIDMLECLGYAVIDGGDGSGLLLTPEVFGEANLVITDLILRNGRNGFMITEKAREYNPEIKVVMMSGYGVADRDEVHILENDAITINKPFNTNMLGGVVSNVLAAGH